MSETLDVQVELEFGSVGFYGGRRIWRTLKKHPRSKDRTNNKLNPLANHWNRTRVTELGGYTNLAPQKCKKGRL